MRSIYLHGFASGPTSKKAAFFRDRMPALEIPDLAADDFEHLTVTGQLQLIENLPPETRSVSSAQAWAATWRRYMLPGTRKPPSWS